jgi:hypothetical protein
MAMGKRERHAKQASMWVATFGPSSTRLTNALSVFVRFENSALL